MKTMMLLFIMLSGILICKAQDTKIIGTWGIIECAYVSNTGTEKIMVDEIKKGTAVTDYFIYNKGKYKMTSNMSGSGTMDTYEGTWKTSDNQLITTVTVNGQTMEITWKYEIEDDMLILSRENPSKTMSIVNTFKKR